MQFNLRAASGTAANTDRAYTPGARRIDGAPATYLRYTFESGHSVAAQYLSLWAMALNRCAIACGGGRLI